MADWHGLLSRSSKGGGGRGAITEEDFEEGDVWSFANESEDSSPKRNSYNEYSSGSSSTWRLTTASRMIPRASNNMPTTGHEAQKVVQQSSAPMKIPEWSKIYGKNANFGSSKNGSLVDGISNGAAYNNGKCHGHGNDDNEDDDDGDDGMVPPHEWLARKMARNKISSFSVCEGIGRTLKGRDLSKVRNAILTKTGFLE